MKIWRLYDSYEWQNPLNQNEWEQVEDSPATIPLQWKTYLNSVMDSSQIHTLKVIVTNYYQCIIHMCNPSNKSTSFVQVVSTAHLACMFNFITLATFLLDTSPDMLPRLLSFGVLSTYIFSWVFTVQLLSSAFKPALSCFFKTLSIQ